MILDETTMPIEKTHKHNPLLERIQLPGETFRLPSGGLFYKNGELDPIVRNGEVHVYPMSAMDEIIIRSPDRILSGEAINEVFRNCIPHIKKPDQLFAKDIDFLLLALRKTTYGATIDSEFTHDCEGAKKHTYTIELGTLINSAKALDPTTLNSKYTITLENNQVVELHPVKFKDIIEIMQEANMQEDANNLEDAKVRLFKSIVRVIYSVDNITDKEMILEWAKKIPAVWYRQISTAIDKSSDWGPNTEHKTKCKDCGGDIIIELPLNPVVFFI